MCICGVAWRINNGVALAPDYRGQLALASWLATMAGLAKLPAWRQ